MTIPTVSTLALRTWFRSRVFLYGPRLLGPVSDCVTCNWSLVDLSGDNENLQGLKFFRPRGALNPA